MILNCTCKHAAQSAKYGPEMRVHNPTKKDTFRCTVCNNERNMKMGGDDTKKKKSK